MMIRLCILSIAMSKATLAGSAMGRQMLAQLISETKPVSEPTVVYLDFKGVDIATGSFLREAVLGFRDFCRNAAGMLYPVVANANASIEEELTIYLKGRNDAIWACVLTSENAINSPHILGELDAAQFETLQILVEHSPTSAPELAKMHPGAGIGVTAWNNRLSSLAAKGVLIELKRGKTKNYIPVMEFV